MAIGRSDAVRQVERLFSRGAVGGLTDGQLLDWFVSRGDGTAEAAFEVLVARHGPMVLRVCRRVLDDPHDAQDAFQATFLVLARKAGSIRSVDSAASWLHGVARRVAARAKVDFARRRAHERRAAEAVPEAYTPAERRHELAVLDEEIRGLPAAFRESVVLCCLEGLSYEAAASRLGVTEGTVRGRLARARDRLRSRLARRGLGTPATPLLAAVEPQPPLAAVSPNLVAATVRASLSLAAGEPAVGSLVSASILSLTREVVNSMFLSKLKLIALCTSSLGLVAVGGASLVGQQPAPGPKADHPQAPRVSQAPAPAPPVLEPEDPVTAYYKALLERARSRLDISRQVYDEGRTTIDRYMDALTQVKIVEMHLARTPETRVATAADYLAKLTALEQKERSALTEGRGTERNVRL